MVQANASRKKYPSTSTDEEVEETIRGLARNIKMFREMRHMTQQDLATRIGSSIAAVQQWEQATTMPGRMWVDIPRKTHRSQRCRPVGVPSPKGQEG